MNTRHILLLLALCTLPLAVQAGQDRARPSDSLRANTWLVAANDDWNSLSEQEQQLLRQHRGRWNSYTPEQKARLREGVQRYQKLSPEQRQNVERERERYETMSPEERRRLRDQYIRSRDR